MFSYLNESAKEYEYLIKAVGALLPFIITVFMAYIAYQQWQTNERQRKQELFEMRHKHLIEPIKQILSELHKNKIYDLLFPVCNFRLYSRSHKSFISAYRTKPDGYKISKKIHFRYAYNLLSKVNFFLTT